ncbi:hypothetical protein [Streptomyces lincolnensis]|uniref:hypothetical protein n=1 Tax=Streptomyces lincolnensis TaxID=1915 RepID=UPI0037D85135
MIHAPASRRPLLWGTTMILGAALGGQGLMATPAEADRLLDEPTAVSGYTYVERVSKLDSTSSRSVSAPCPSGKVVLAGGARIVGGGQRVLLRGTHPSVSSSRHTWSASAQEVSGGTRARWYVRAYAVCAAKPAGLVHRQASSKLDSGSPKSAATRCRAGTRLIGLGARVVGADHRVGVNSVTASRGLTSSSARAGEAVSTPLRWAVISYSVCAKPLQQVLRESAWKSVTGAAQSQTAFARCPLGSRAYGTGVQISGTVSTLNRLVPVALHPTRIPPVPAGGRATVSELAPGTPSTWHLKAQIICIR